MSDTHQTFNGLPLARQFNNSLTDEPVNGLIGPTGDPLNNLLSLSRPLCSLLGQPIRHH